MLKNRRSGRVSTKISIEDEIAHLRGLDLKGLRSRWQSVFQRPPPGHLPRHLIFAIIAYRIQADRVGDLDHETRQVLDRTDAKNTGGTMSARLVSFDQKRTELTPGTILVRDWDRGPFIVVQTRCSNNTPSPMVRKPSLGQPSGDGWQFQLLGGTNVRNFFDREKRRLAKDVHNGADKPNP